MIIGGDLGEEQEVTLLKFLKDNWDIFAWRPADMPGVPARITQHILDIRKDARPVKQALQRFA